MTKNIIWLLLLVLILENRCSFCEDECKDEPKCKVYHTHGIKATDCYDKNFYSFPKCLPSDVEVIELTRNRIRKVTNSDLTRYKYLKFLYLTDNLLSKLDDETFTNLASLSSLDLSLNALDTIPPTIFQLPNLKTLTLRQNSINIASVMLELETISSPLKVLDISQTADAPQDFPDLGIMPLLRILNVTKNRYVSMTPRHFAGLCNLNKFVNNNATTEYKDFCDCWIINKWLEERGVQFIPFVCPLPENKCSDKSLSDEDRKVYEQCQEVYGQIQMSQRLTKIGVGIGITIVVVLILALICLMWMRRRRNARRAKMEAENRAGRTDYLVPLTKELNNASTNK